MKRSRRSLVTMAWLVVLALACTPGEAAEPSGSTVARSADPQPTAVRGPVASVAGSGSTATTVRPIPRPAAETEGLRQLRGVGIPDGAAQAYLNASAKVRDISGHCHVPVEILAAVGKIESNHGQVAEMDEYGRTREILRGYASTGPDTDGGEIDGDDTQDWAVGPMQFIPDSWKAYGQDGDGDGAADPHDFFDAALSTAWYLCDKVGGFYDVTILNGQWNAWDQQVAAARARFEANHQRWQQAHDRRTVLGYQVLAHPTDVELARQFAAAPVAGPEPVYVEPPEPPGPAQFKLAMQRYYGPEGKEGDDYIAQTAAVFRSLETMTLGVPVVDADRVEPR